MLALLVVPIASVTLIMLLHYGYTELRFLETLPYLCIQVNTIFTWACVSCLGFYQSKNFPSKSFGEALVNSLLENAIYFGGINTFLYTWHFIASLERNQSSKWKPKYKAFRTYSMILAPTIYLSLFVAIVISVAKRDWYKI